jgi:hypothetical protein
MARTLTLALGPFSLSQENDVVNEPNGWGYPISKLPGDNPLWSGPSAIKVRLLCFTSGVFTRALTSLLRMQPATAGYKEASGYVTGHSVLPSGWSRVGCMAEAQSGRALNAASWTSTNMVRLLLFLLIFQTCRLSISCTFYQTNYCDGLKLPLSGVEFGQGKPIRSDPSSFALDLTLSLLCRMLLRLQAPERSCQRYHQL